MVEKNAPQIEVIRRLLLRFVVSGGGSKPDGTRPLTLTDCAPDELPFVKEFVNAGVLQEELDKTPPVLRLANEDLLRKWQLLNDWIEADREFLTWRNWVDSAAASWQSSNRNPTALLRDDQLRAAMKWEGERGLFLLPDTLAFLHESERNDPSAAAENVARSIPEPVVPGFFLQFVTAGGSRRFVDAEDVFPDAVAARQAVQLGLLREVAGGPNMKITGASGYTLVSDELVYRWPPLKLWLAENAAFLAVRDEAVLLARGWAEEQRSPRRLLRGEQLQRLSAALKQRSEGELTRLVRDFIAESEKGDPLRRADDIVKTCPPDQLPILKRFFLRFVSLGAGGRPESESVRTSDPDAAEEGFIRMALAASLISSVSPESYTLSEPGLISEWEWFSKLIERERDFLLLRTRLETQARLWSDLGEKRYPLSASDYRAWNKATAGRPSEGSGLLRRYVGSQVAGSWARLLTKYAVAGVAVLVVLGVWLAYHRIDGGDPLSTIQPGMERGERAGLIANAIQQRQASGATLDQKLAKSLQDLDYLGTIAGAGTPSQRGWQLAFTEKDGVIACSEQRIDIYDIKSKSEQLLPGYAERTIDLGASACAYDPNSAVLACSRKPGLLEFFDYGTLKVKQALVIPSQGKGTVIRFSPDGRFWALGDDQGTVVYGPNPVSSPLGHSNVGVHGKAIEALDWADDNLHFATAAGTTAAVIWDVRTEKSRLELLADQNSVHDVQFAPQAGFSSILAAAGSDGVWIWSDVLGARRRIEPYGCEAFKVAFRERTEHAASVSDLFWQSRAYPRSRGRRDALERK